MLNIFSLLAPCFWQVLFPLLGLALAALALGAFISSYFSGKKIFALNADINSHQKNYADLSGEYQATLAQKTTLEQEKEQLGAELDTSIADWTGKHEKLSYSFEVLNKKHLDLFSNHTDLEKKYTELEGKYGDLGRKNLALSNQYTEKETEAANYKTQLADLSGKYTQKESELGEKVAVAAAATLALSQIKDSFDKKNTDWETKEANWKAEMALLQQKYNELEQQYHEAAERPKGLVLRSAEEIEAEQSSILAEIETHKPEFDWERIGAYSGTGKKDNLKRLRGVNPFIEKKMHAIGIHSFRQIANLNEEDQEKLNGILGLSKKKFQKEEWVFQSRRMVGLILDELPDVILGRIAANTANVNYNRIGTASAANKDNLQAIGNISAFDEARLNALGIYKYSQIAAFTKTDAKQINKMIEIEEGRIVEEDWIAQAEKLMHSTMADILARIAERKGEINWARIGTATESEKQDLQLISGIGLFIEEKLYALGILTYSQIARFHADDIAKMTTILEIPAGQIEGDEWVAQAKTLGKA